MASGKKEKKRDKQREGEDVHPSKSQRADKAE
jgi:hypothetical protein